MGHIRHHAIIVTSWDGHAIEAAWDHAKGLDMSPTDISDPQVNGYQSFLIPPDGSKEGWTASDDGDSRRYNFTMWLRTQRHDDKSSPLEWVEVEYGSDDRSARVADSEWRKGR